MNLNRSFLRGLHRFLERRFFYKVSLFSLLSIGVLAGRAYLSGEATYSFMLWNLILAWLPYLFALLAVVCDRRYRRGWTLAIPGALWLLFFPNAPYMITDLIHLKSRTPIPVWYDAILLITFAWTGCLLAVSSLHMMQTLVRARVGRRLSWLFVAVTLGLTGLGVYLGRFLHWNSWDIFVRPRSVLAGILAWLANPLHHLGAYGIILLFAAFLFVFYLSFVSHLPKHLQPK